MHGNDAGIDSTSIIVASTLSGDGRLGAFVMYTAVTFYRADVMHFLDDKVEFSAEM